MGDTAAAADLGYEVRANNLSRASENRIHDDAVARRFGFTGALVPGVEVHAYACHPAVARWGRAWLERGRIATRFLKPVYDGAPVRVAATPGEDGALALRLESGGVLCATGEAALPAEAEAPPDLASFPAAPPPAEATRPPASEASLAPGLGLGTRPEAMTAAVLAAYLEGIAETEPLYAAEGLVHPGLVLRLCNKVLTQNVVLGPWIHVGSTVRSLASARLGETLEARARVLANAERKGHAMVDLEVLVLADGVRPVARVLHTAIWRPRQAG